jgi:shikimate kinase
MKKINAFQRDIPSIVENLTKPLVLVGMMGAGKSHIGFALAQVLDIPFFDTDKEIAEKAGMSIPEIFKTFGEEKFRDSEKRALADLMQEAPCVIASGGGALMNPETLARLKADSIMIWLDIDIDTILERVKNSDRPLIQTENPRKTLETLMAMRRPLYEQAHLRVSDKAEAAGTIETILKSLSEPPFLYT